MTRVYIAGYFGAGNFGDELLLSLMLEALSDTSDPIVVSRDPEHSRRTHNVEAVTADKLPSMLNETDRLIVGPGGLFHNTSGPQTHQRHGGLAHIGRWVEAASNAGTPVAVFCVSLGPYRGKTAPEITERILAAADRVYTRDTRQTTSNGHMFSVMPDVSFSLPPFGGPRGGTPAVALRTWEPVERVEASIAATIGTGFERLSLQPGDDGTPVAVQWSVDPRRSFARPLLITMRYHAACMAMQSGTPTVIIDLGDPKMADLAGATGTPIIAVDEVTAATLKAAIDDANENTLSLERLTELRQSVKGSIDELLGWVTGPADSHPMRLPAFPRLRLLGALGMLDRARSRLIS